MNTFIAQSKWEMLRQIRNRRFIVFTVMIPLFYYFLFVHINGPQSSFGGTSWKAYFLMSMASFSVIGSAINGLSSRIAFERTQGWLRLVRTTPLPPVIYVASKVVSQVAVALLLILVLDLAGALGESVHMSIATWLATGAWLALGSLPFIALAVLIGFIAGTEAAGMISSGVYFILSIIGGLWWPVSIMPKVLQDIAHWTPTYRFTHVAWQLVANHPITPSDLVVTAAYFILFSALGVWVVRRQQGIMNA